MLRLATRTRHIACFRSTMASPPPDKKLKLSSGDNLHSYRSEEDVGITEHANDHPGFFGVLKARYSDFLVHEISRAKEVVHLTDLSTLPVQLVKTPSLDVLSQEQQSELSALLDDTNDDSKVMINVEGYDKEQRSQIHKCIRHFYPKLISTTITDSDQRCIEVVRANSVNKNRSNWQQGRGDYCQFVLYKENTDTVDAVGVLARTLRVKPKLLQYAGTKDKRAVTSQLITAYRIEAERLREVNSVFSNIKIGNFQYVKESLFLGDLSGNQFTVALRNVAAEDSVIGEAVKALKQSGFINYFGMQRFGTASAPTHAIGKCILLEDWLGAVELILQPRKGDSEGMANVKQEWWKSRDPVAALAKGSPDKSSSALLLRGLVKHGPWKDYVNALHFIPRGTRLMYVHSYQSLIWNKIASRRVKEFGLKPIEGDLVMKSGNEVQCLTADDIGNYSIEDVVLPLPGHSITYPNNEVNQWYMELLEQDKLSSEKLRCRVKDYSLSGDYRPLMIKPDDITWYSVYYDEVKGQLLETDKDRLEGTSLSQPSSGAHKAAVVKFALPSGCYATMALRELLKKDTSWVAQQAYVQQLGIPELYTGSPPTLISPKHATLPASPKHDAPSMSPKHSTPPASPKQNDT